MAYDDKSDPERQWVAESKKESLSKLTMRGERKEGEKEWRDRVERQKKRVKERQQYSKWERDKSKVRGRIK